jgi:hypothetical protein
MNYDCSVYEHPVPDAPDANKDKQLPSRATALIGRLLFNNVSGPAMNAALTTSSWLIFTLTATHTEAEKTGLKVAL